MTLLDRRSRYRDRINDILDACHQGVESPMAPVLEPLPVRLPLDEAFFDLAQVYVAPKLGGEPAPKPRAVAD